MSLDAASDRVGLVPADYGTVSTPPTRVEGVEFGAAHVGFVAPGGLRHEIAIADLVGSVSTSTASETVVSAIVYTVAASGCCGSGDAAANRTRHVVAVACFPKTADGGARADRLSTALSCAAQGLDVKGPRPRPRRLLAYVNPKSGPGKGAEIFRTACAQMLEDAGCTVTVVETQRAGHSADELRALPAAELLSYDGVLAGGGDGSLHELVQGVFARADWAVVAQRVVLGHLPLGSGNGITASLCSAARLPYSVSNATLFVAKNARTPLDIASVFAAGGGVAPGWGERRYSFLSTAWGIVGDLDIESEALRFLGAARFDVMGTVRALALRRYQGRLWYLPAEPEGVAVTPYFTTPLSSNAADVERGEGLADVPPSTPRGGAPPIVAHLRPFGEPLTTGAGGERWQCIEGPFTLV